MNLILIRVKVLIIMIGECVDFVLPSKMQLEFSDPYRKQKLTTKYYSYNGTTGDREKGIGSLLMMSLLTVRNIKYRY